MFLFLAVRVQQFGVIMKYFFTELYILQEAADV